MCVVGKIAIFLFSGVTVDTLFAFDVYFLKFLVVSDLTVCISGIQKINQLIIDYYFLIMTRLSLALQLVLPEFQVFLPSLKIHRTSLLVAETAA